MKHQSPLLYQNLNYLNEEIPFYSSYQTKLSNQIVDVSLVHLDGSAHHIQHIVKADSCYSLIDNRNDDIP
jgi:hypothetical protein